MVIFYLGYSLIEIKFATFLIHHALTLINAFFFFFVALIYSSAGFGGGSMYLALLAQTSWSDVLIRFTGLSCNTLVTTVGSINFIRGGWIFWKPTLQLLAFSVPFAMFASSIKLNGNTYFIILGICLFLAAILMLFQKRNTSIDSSIPHNKWYIFPVSACIGFISGLTGIGGGVYLSPVLHLTKWGSSKHIAATSSMFILINSIGSLAIQFLTQDVEMEGELLLYLSVVFAGAMIGSNLSSSAFKQIHVRYITIILILFASVRILSKYL